MNCVEATTKMKDYLEDELSVRETLKLISHLKSCPDCRDEAEVQLLVSSVTEMRGESRESYDLSNLLQKKIRSQERWIFRMRLLTLFSILITVVLFVILAVLLING